MITYERMLRARRPIFAAVAIGAAAWLLAVHPPVRSAGPGEVGVRTNQLTGRVTHWQGGTVLVIPGVHAVQVFAPRPPQRRMA